MKKLFFWMFIVTFLAGSSGCSSLQKKFTRKPKTPSHVPSVIYFEEGPYQKKYSNEYYYKTHYTLWKTWQSEWINQLGGNHKKVERCAEESLNNLTEMGRYLDVESQAKFKGLLGSLSDLEKKVELGNVSKSDEGPMRVELEKIKRMVENDFYYDKVKDHLLPDTVNL